MAIALATARAHDPITTRVTWTGEVSRIVQARCVSCHSPGGRGPMPLTSYEEARPWARAIKEEVLTRRMPKWHAARGYGDFANDPSLSVFELALIAAWADGGAPERPRPERGRDSLEPLRSANALSSSAGGGAPARAREGWGLASADKSAQGARELVVPCREQPLPEGRLLAVRPTLQPGDDIGIAVRLPDGRREIVAWIRNFDPDFPMTYWLRAPVDLAKGSVLAADRREQCQVTLTLTARR